MLGLISFSVVTFQHVSLSRMDVTFGLWELINQIKSRRQYNLPFLLTSFLSHPGTPTLPLFLMAAPSMAFNIKAPEEQRSSLSKLLSGLSRRQVPEPVPTSEGEETWGWCVREDGARRALAARSVQTPAATSLQILPHSAFASLVLGTWGPSFQMT